MYTIEEAGKATGLPEKRIQLYVEGGLIKEPLTETEMDKLKDIQWLRERGIYGETELKSYILNPGWVPGCPELCFDKVQNIKKRKEEEAAGKYTVIFRVVLLLAAAGVLLYTYLDGCLNIGIGAIFAAAALAYFGLAFCIWLETAISGKQTHKVIAEVKEVKMDRRFDSSLVTAGGGDTPVRGIAPAWLVFFLEIVCQLRTDCYYANVAFTDEAGKAISGRMKVSGWKNTWSQGDKIEVVWDGSSVSKIYPADRSFYKKKMVIALFKLVIMAVIAVVLLIRPY